MENLFSKRKKKKKKTALQFCYGHLEVKKASVVSILNKVSESFCKCAIFTQLKLLNHPSPFSLGIVWNCKPLLDC